MNALPSLRRLAPLALLLLAPAVHAQHGPEPIRTTDLLLLKQVGDVAVSPDGRYAVYTVRGIEEEAGAQERYAYRTHLWLVPIGGGEPPRPLTRGPESATQPAWDPRSERIAFVRNVDRTPQLFILPFDGGEALQLTALPHGVSAPRWSPDGTRILFSASIPERDVLRDSLADAARRPWERPGRDPVAPTAGADPNGSLDAIRAWLDRNAEDGNPRVLNRLNFQGETDLAPGLSYRHFYVVEAREGARPAPLTRGFASFTGGAWSPDGRQIYLTGLLDPERHPDRLDDGDLFVLDADGTNLRRLLDLEGYTLSAPLPAPDGREIALLATAHADSGYAQSEIALVPLREGGFRFLTEAFDRAPANLHWSPNSWFLYFTAPSNGGVPLYRIPVHGPAPALPAAADPLAPDSLAGNSLAADSLAAAADSLAADSVFVQRLTAFDRGVQDYDLSRGSIVYALTEVANPSELYASTLDGSAPKRLTTHNASWLEGRRVSFPERRTLVRDSLEIEYWVMKPAFPGEGRRYPLLVEMHGGPAAMWGPGEFTMWHEFQFFAARGYGIVYGNPRGSGGYGFRFRRANFQDWGAGPAADVLAVASEAAAEPWADSTRQLLTGGSYAGYLTAWIIAHDHRFRAAAAQRGVYDLATFLGEGNAWRLVPNHFGGYPWQPEFREILAAGSPLTFVERIRTPLLILHGDRDLRTGVVQSEMLYRSLKLLGRPVEYVRYPGAGHDLTRTGDPKQRMDHLLRIYEFMERFLAAEPAPPPAAETGPETLPSDGERP